MIPSIHRTLVLHHLEVPSTLAGWPITDECVAACGLPCGFSRCWATPYPARSRNSMCTQVGNAMSVNTIGSVVASMILVHPEIYGATLPPSSPPCQAQSAPASSSSSSALPTSSPSKKSLARSLSDPDESCLSQPATTSSKVDAFSTAMSELRRLKRRKS